MENMDMPKELLDRFMERTGAHIKRVITNAEKLESAFPVRFRGLADRTTTHDESKCHDPELTPYVWLTEYHRCKNNGIPFTYPPGMKERVGEATLHHVRANDHHGEFFDPDKGGIKLGKSRESLNEMCDSTAMPDLALAEMVCDWAAMSQELNDSLRGWADKKVNKRWKFTPNQVNTIYQIVDFFEPKNSFSEKLDRALL